MQKKNYKAFSIIIFCFLLSTAFSVVAQVGPDSTNQLKINSVKESIYLGTNIYVKGQSSPNIQIFLSIQDEKNSFAYSIKTKSNSAGNWSANFDQSLKSGKYYINAEQQDVNGSLISQVKYGPIQIKGSFAFIVSVFSFLVVLLLAGFVGGWYINKLAEVKRYRRIIISQRDIISSYGVLKNDVNRALKTLGEEKEQDWKITEAEFLLKRINENLEKMDKYVVKGVNIISNYDIIRKIDNLLKLNFKKNDKSSNS